MFSVGHTACLIFLDITGMGFNAAFLYTIKKRPSPRNSIDLLQTIKTSVIMVALVLCLAIEFIPCSRTTQNTCDVLKEIINDITFHSMCWMFLSIAFVRLKVCTCRGRASVLVTSDYALKVLAVCLVPVLISSVASLIIAVYDSGTADTATEQISEVHSNLSSSAIGTLDVFIRLSHVLLLNVIPIIAGCLIYKRVLNIVNERSVITEAFVANRKINLAKVIKESVTMLIVITSIMWPVYICLDITTIFTMIDPVVIIYWKVILINAQPFGEGLIKRHKILPKDTNSRHIPTTINTASPELFKRSQLKLLTGQAGSDITEIDSSMSEIRKFVDLQNIRTGPRKSVLHSQTSFHFQNGSLVSLEVRDGPEILDFERERKVSKSKLKDGLQEIEVNAQKAKYSDLRNMSDGHHLPYNKTGIEDEVFENYRILYQRRSSKMFPHQRRSFQEVSGFEDSWNNNFSTRKKSGSSPQSRWKQLATKTRPSRKVLPDVRSTPPTIDERDDIYSSKTDITQTNERTSTQGTKSGHDHLSRNDKTDKERNMSPSLEHWRDIVKTTITVQRLSKWQERRKQELEPDTSWCPPYKPMATANLATGSSAGVHITNENHCLSVMALAQQPQYTYLEKRSHESGIPQKTTTTNKEKSSTSAAPDKKSKRSISCVSRSDLHGVGLHDVTQKGTPRTRNMSVSFGPGFIGKDEFSPRPSGQKSTSFDQTASKDASRITEDRDLPIKKQIFKVLKRKI